MDFRIVSGVCVLVESAESPSDEEWDRLLDAIDRAGDLQAMCVLTHGGMPTAGQRDRAGKAWQKSRTRPPIAVLSSSLFVRTIVNAMSWIAGEKIKVFGQADLDGAFKHLALGPDQRAAVRAVIDSMSIVLRRTG